MKRFCTGVDVRQALDRITWNIVLLDGCSELHPMRLVYMLFSLIFKTSSEERIFHLMGENEWRDRAKGGRWKGRNACKLWNILHRHYQQHQRYIRGTNAKRTTDGKRKHKKLLFLTHTWAHAYELIAFSFSDFKKNWKLNMT